MTMLLNPSPGEIFDRMTILRLKIAFGTVKGRTTKAWEDEQAELSKLIKVASIEIANIFERVKEQIDDKVEELYGTNLIIWKLEDKLRALPECDICTTAELEDIAKTAKGIAKANDRRMELVRDLNNLFNQPNSATGAVKIYG